jgi:Spy/CpxP family protein refolding chaperone
VKISPAFAPLRENVLFEVKMRFKIVMILMAGVLLLTVLSTSHAQDPAPPLENADPIEQLRLSPEQRQRIRTIFEQNKDERQLINRKVRAANIALDQALDAEPADESLVEQRVNELATAQAAQMRMRVQTELRIRRELRPEQLATLRRLRLQVRDVMDAQRPNNRRPLRQRLRPRNR